MSIKPDKQGLLSLKFFYCGFKKLKTIALQPDKTNLCMFGADFTLQT